MRSSMSHTHPGQRAPAAVRDFLPSCSDKGLATVSASCDCSDSVGGDRCRASAAGQTVVHSHSQKIRSWCKVAWRRFMDAIWLIK